MVHVHPTILKPVVATIVETHSHLVHVCVVLLLIKSSQSPVDQVNNVFRHVYKLLLNVVLPMSSPVVEEIVPSLLPHVDANVVQTYIIPLRLVCQQNNVQMPVSVSMVMYVNRRILSDVVMALFVPIEIDSLELVMHRQFHGPPV